MRRADCRIREFFVTEFTSFELAGNLRVTVAAPTAPGLAPAGLRPKAVQAEQTLRQALRPVTSAAEEVIEGFRTLPGRPDEIEIQFGVQLNATFGAVIATAAVGTHLEVTLRWATPRPADDGVGDREPKAVQAPDSPVVRAGSPAVAAEQLPAVLAKLGD
jgi:hypothetical protein